MVDRGRVVAGSKTTDESRRGCEQTQANEGQQGIRWASIGHQLAACAYTMQIASRRINELAEQVPPWVPLESLRIRKRARVGASMIARGACRGLGG